MTSAQEGGGCPGLRKYPNFADKKYLEICRQRGGFKIMRRRVQNIPKFCGRHVRSPPNRSCGGENTRRGGKAVIKQRGGAAKDGGDHD